MKRICLAVSAIVVVGLVELASASRRPEPPLHPKAYRSPSGELSLYVNPSKRQGQGSAEYRLLKGSREIWHGERPFTLRDVRVLDDGTAAGYGYTLGLEGWGGESRDDDGDFVIAIFDPEGKTRLHEAVERGFGGFLDQYPQPEAQGLVVDAENDRLIVLVADPDINEQNTAWQQYRLSTGESLGTIHPKENMTDSDRLHWSHAPQQIRGTPLTLVQWFRSEREPYLKGTHFALVDLEGKPVWQRTLRDDYSIPGDEEAEDRLFEWFLENSAILAVKAAGRFDLYFVKKEQRVSFSVQQDKAGQWAVTEIGREKYKLPEEPTTSQVAGQPEGLPPQITLDYLGAIELSGDSAKPERPFDEHDLRGFVVDEQGRFVFIRNRTGKALDLLRIDEQGAVVNCVPLPALKDEHERWSGHAWLGGDRFVVAKSQYGVGAKSEAWIVDFASTKLTPLPDFECPSVEAIVGLPNGSFVVLGRHRYKYTMTDELRGYDAKGRLQWKVSDGQPDDHERLFSPKDICLTADGLIAVVEVIGDNVKFYDQSGQFVRLIDLTEAWGREPSYPAGIEAMPNGELIVADAVASGGVFVRMAADGKILGEFSLQFPDGRRFVSSLQIGPDGRMWAAHGRAVLEVNKEGVVKHVVGEAPASRRLDRIAAAAMDSRGRLYVLDEHSYCVHVFSPEGKRVLVCVPDPHDIPTCAKSFPNITISDTGEIFVSGADGASAEDREGYIRFSANGEYQGISRLGLDSITEEWHFQPGTGHRWVRRYENVFLVDAENRVIKTIERRPDGHWLEGPDELAVAPDGSVIVLDGSSFLSDAKPSFNIYSPDGTPIRTFLAPTLKHSCARIAFGGERIAAIGFEGPLVLLDRSGAACKDVEAGKKLTPNRDRFLFLSSDGKELRLLDAETRIVHRYAVPGAE
jgi:hypothetical protein